MNIAQIIRRSLFGADAVNLDSTTQRFFTQTELLAWANDGKDAIEKGLNAAKKDFNLKFLMSAAATGSITTTTLNAAGTGYVPGDSGIVNTGNANAVYVIDTVGGGGSVSTYHIAATGSGYVVANGITTTIGTGAGAGFKVNITVISAGGAFRWDGETYDPASFSLVSGTYTYNLPPDVVKVRSLRSATAGAYRFEHLDISHPYFRDLQNRTDITNPIYWDIVGNRTLVLANPQTLDVELAYVARTRKLFMYTTGTYSVNQNSTAVTGSTTTWVISELSTPCELIGVTDTNTPKVASQVSGGNWVDPTTIYNFVRSIDSDTGLTLAGNWLPASVSSKNYMLASIPNIPYEYHWILVDYITARCLIKGNHPKAAEKMAAVDQAIAMIAADSEREESAARVTGAFPDTQPGMTWAGVLPGSGMGGMRPGASGGQSAQ